jgi:FkbM family methyltransferase
MYGLETLLRSRQRGVRSVRAMTLRAAISLSGQCRFLHRLAHRLILSQETRLMHLRQSGFAPVTVFDIGAFHGHWTAAVQRVFNSRKFYCFEANEDNRWFLALAGHPFDIVALSAKNEKKAFYRPHAGMATGASLYIEDTEHYRNPDIVTVQTRQLDQVVREHGWPRPDLMKLDVQGAELDVLAGGTECLDHCRFVIIETSIRRYNLGAPLIGDVVEVSACST